METIANITFFAASILMVVVYRFYLNAKLMLADAYEINQDTIEREKRLKPKMAVAQWKNLIETYQKDEKYELCEIIKSNIEGKEDNEIIETPYPFIITATEDGLMIYAI
jgi:hypothetical protein